MSFQIQSRFSVAALLLAGVTLAWSAQAALSSIGASEVQFRAVGPAGLTIEGKGSKLTASETDGSLTIVVPLSDVQTGIALRDDHLKKALKVGQHPQATLVVPRSQLSFPEDNQEKEGTATGQLTLHGVTKPKKFSYKVKRTGSDYHVQGRFDVDITEHNMEIPCYLGVCVDKEVKVKAKFKLRDN